MLVMKSCHEVYFIMTQPVSVEPNAFYRIIRTLLPDF